MVWGLLQAFFFAVFSHTSTQPLFRGLGVGFDSSLNIGISVEMIQACQPRI